MPAGAADKLLECARRILPASNGPVEASNDLVAEHLTDWLLVLASDAVKAALVKVFAQVFARSANTANTGFPTLEYLVFASKY